MRNLIFLVYKLLNFRSLRIFIISLNLISLFGCSLPENYLSREIKSYSSRLGSGKVEGSKNFVIIKGQVNYQRAVFFDRTLTLSEAVDTCSGFTEFADLENIQITRSEEKIYYNLVKDYKISEIKLEPNDIVEIPFNNPDL